MTPDHTSRELVELLCAQQPTDDVESPLGTAWRRAESEADAAYEAWRKACNADAYVVYLAAEDRAAGAHGELVSWMQARDAGTGRPPARVAA